VEFEVKDTQDRLTGFEQKLREGTYWAFPKSRLPVLPIVQSNYSYTLRNTDTLFYLSQANSGGGDVLGNIGGRNAGPLKKLCDMVQTRASSFSTSPIGPIGMHIKLKDQAWANAVEDHIGQSLGTWLVATMADRNALHGMMRRECGFQGNLPTITVMNLKRAKYAMPREKLPPQGMRTMLGILEIEHDCVFNVLVDFSSVERIVLVPDQGTAVNVVKEHRTVFEAFSKDRRVKQSGPGVTNDRAFHANLNPKLAADQKQLVAALKADIANCKSKVLSLRKDLAAAQAAFESAKNVVVDQRREERVVRNDLAAAEDALADANTAADEQLGDGGVDIGALEADLGPIVLELEGVLKKKGEVLAKEIDAARVASRSAHDEHEALKLRAGDNEPVYERLQHELDVANKTLIEAKSHAAYYEGRRNELAEKIAENDTSVAQLREAITCSMHGAKMLCDRATAETYLDADGRDASVAELGKMYEQVKKRVSKEEQRFGRPMDRVQRELSAQETHLNRLNATLENSRGPCRKLQQGVKTRQRLLKEASVHVQKEVSHRFNTYLGKKGNAGKITVDYNKGLLVLDVKMAGSGSTVKDTRSLSGGERSYSTLALTLSLGEAIESPFRAMDEFDVFMDAVNRKVSMDNLIEFARDDLNCDKQFLFITPQDISAVCAADSDIKVQRMKAARPN
jgi:chromosome segregation ATPase